MLIWIVDTRKDAESYQVFHYQHEFYGKVKVLIFQDFGGYIICATTPHTLLLCVLSS